MESPNKCEIDEFYKKVNLTKISYEINSSWIIIYNRDKLFEESLSAFSLQNFNFKNVLQY